MAFFLEELLRPYTAAMSGQEVSMKHDPVYSTLAPTPERLAAAQPSARQNPPEVGGIEGLIRRMAARRYGWTGQQADALVETWTRESGLNPMADNPTSSAFGIPQALTALHDLPPGYEQGKPRPQISWGLDYIDDRYGSPLDALAFWNTHNWY